MIQTQLLRLDPPYQIISAGGRVGIQVATLIVIEDKTTEDGSYAIDTHSHPVVNYGLKQGLEEELPQARDPMYMNYLRSRLQPEGAVWNKVEVNKVYVLGLAGIQNKPITMKRFVWLIPADPNSDWWYNVWNENSINMIRWLAQELEDVNLICAPWSPSSLDMEKNVTVFLHLGLSPLNPETPLVRVTIKDSDKVDANNIEKGISFAVRLFDNEGKNIVTNEDGKFVSTDRCVKLICKAMNELRTIFFRNKSLSFSYLKLQEHSLENVVESIVEQVNSTFKSK